MNKVYVACAGSGKTTYIVDSSMKLDGNVLITTFTDSNTEEIYKKFIERYGLKKTNIFIIPWFTFLLDHLIRPYQLTFIDEKIKNIIMVNGKSTVYLSKDSKDFYINKGEIYSDKIAALAFRTMNEKGGILKRLCNIFDYIFIDEFQDFSGYDLDIVKLIAEKGISVNIVCDPRQHTFPTHYDAKNHKYSCEPLKYIEDNCSNLFTIDCSTLNGSYRCPQNTIKYASEIFPDFPQSNSNKIYEEGDGVFFVKQSEVKIYLQTIKNIFQLRHSKRTIVDENYPVLSFKKSKGLTLENVIVYPPKTMLKAITSNDFKSLASATKSELYVALTRARHKTIIVVPDKDHNKFEKVLEHINSYLK